MPTAEQLASVLVTVDDYDGKWTLNVPLDTSKAVPSVVPDDKQESVPEIEFCGKASEESRSVVAALRWQAFRELDQSEDDPIDIAAGDRDGMQACQGKILAGVEGPGKSEPMTIPAVGDDRYGELHLGGGRRGGLLAIAQLFGAAGPGPDVHRGGGHRAGRGRSARVHDRGHWHVPHQGC